MSKRLQKEFESIQKNTQEMKVSLPNNDLTLWHVNFPGAKGTLYEGEQFCLQLRFNNDYVLFPTSSQLSLQKLSSLGMSLSMNISTLMDSYVYLFCTIVSIFLF